MRINGKVKSNKPLTVEVFGGYELEVDKMYSFDVKDYKSQRSLQQNSKMWAIINDIVKETGQDDMDIYIIGLEHAKVKFDYIMALPEIESALKKAFRAVKIMENRNIDGKTLTVFKCFYGSSKMDTQEFTILLEFFINLASDLGIVV